MRVVALPGAGALASPRLVADPAGGAVAAWADGGDVVVASIREDAIEEELRAGCAGRPISIALAAGPAGPVVAWSGHDGTAFACVRHERTWRVPTPLSAPAAGVTLVDAAAACDRAVAVWTAASGAVEGASFDPGDGWVADGPVGAPAGGALTPQVALGPGGEAVAAWIGPDSQVAWAARPSGGPWSPGPDLTPSGHGASGLRLRAAPDGTAVLAWTAADAAVRVSRLALGQLAHGASAKWRAAWTDPVVVSTPGEPGYAPRLAAGAAGALVAWHRVDGRIQACLLGPDGRAGAPVDLSAEGEPGLYPWPALGDGAAAVAWRGDGNLVSIARRGPGGWSAPERVTAPGAAPSPPLAAVDEAGGVVVAY